METSEEEFLTIKEVHLIMLDIFDDVLNYLNQHQVTYVLTGGSALGAVRHRGFIPWDDDIDIAIPRDEYNEFLKNYRPTKANLKVISVYDVKNSDIPYMRVVNTKTASSNQYLNVNNGIFIDVFPIDHIADNRFKQKLAYYHIKLLDSLRNSTRRIDYNADESIFKNFLKHVFTWLVRHKEIGYYSNKMNQVALKINKKNRKSHMMTLLVVQGINGMRENQAVSIYTDQRQKAVFEGRKVYIPGPGYLQNQFTSKYMEIPIEHKAHGNFYMLNEVSNEG